jgi:small GTP-binding protein
LIIASKVILCGDEAVGKTSLRNKFLGTGFDSSYLPTMGADVSILNYTYQSESESTNFKFSIWDLAGHNAFFKTVLPRFYSGSQGILLMYDVTVESSFNNIYMWLDEIKKELDLNKTTIILVANKIDLKRLITADQGEELARNISNDYLTNSEKILFIEMSALTGKNIDKTLNVLAESLLMKFGNEQSRGN